jgi:hypothetical protein
MQLRASGSGTGIDHQTSDREIKGSNLGKMAQKEIKQFFLNDDLLLFSMKKKYFQICLKMKFKIFFNQWPVP